MCSTARQILCYSLKLLPMLSEVLKYLECRFLLPYVYTLCTITNWSPIQFLDQNMLLFSLYFVEDAAPSATSSVFLFSWFYVSWLVLLDRPVVSL